MTGLPIDKDLVLRVASLSKLRLDDAQAEHLGVDLGRILSYVEQLREVDVTAIEPLAHPTDLHDSFRDDRPTAGLSREEALSNSPRHDGQCFQVPAVLG